MLKSTLSVAVIFAAGSVVAAPVAIVNPNFDVPGDSDFVNTGETSPATDGVTGYTATLDLFGDFAFYGANFNGAFQITDATGTLSESNLLVKNSRVETEQGSRVAVNAGDTATFTFDGVLEFDGAGFLAGIDFFDGAGDLIAPGTAESTFMAANAGGIANQELGLSVSGVAPTGAVSLGLRVEAIDGTQIFRVDNFRLDVVPVPEPASLGLLAIGAGMMMGRRR